MVDINGFLYKNRKIIIMVGLVIGGLGIIDFLPPELPLVTNYTTYVYLGVIALAGYVFYSNYLTDNKPVYAKNVMPRSLSNPHFRNEINRQMGGYEGSAQQPRVPKNPSSSSISPTSPSKDVFDRFNSED